MKSALDYQKVVLVQHPPDYVTSGGSAKKQNDRPPIVRYYSDGPDWEVEIGPRDKDATSRWRAVVRMFDSDGRVVQFVNVIRAARTLERAFSAVNEWFDNLRSAR